MTATFGVLLLALAGSSAADAPKSVVYEVSAGKYERRDTPLMVPLPDALRDEAGFSLEDLDTHTFVPVQVAPHQMSGFVGVSWIVREPIPVGKSRRYRLSTDTKNLPKHAPGGVHAFRDGMAVRDDGKEANTLTLKVGDRPVLTYQAAIAQPPAGIDPVFARGGFLHPLQTPSGAVVTDDFPPDHPHQHGVFLAWVDTTFEGRHVDFWNQKAKTGRVAPEDSHRAFHNSAAGGPVFGELLASLNHDDLSAPGEPALVVHEFWLIVVYNLAGAFVVDFTSAQHIDNHPLTINKYHYGGFGLRGNRQWLDPTAQGDAAPDPSKSGRSDFRTSDSKHRADGNHTRPRWVDLSGRVDGKVAGVSVLDHPSNFRFPQPVRLHPNKPYFCFAPMVDDAFTMTVGHPHVSRYRLLLHDGPPDQAAIERIWHDYAEPPKVRVVEEKR